MYRKMAPFQAVASKQPRHFWVVGIGRVRGIETWELDQSQRDRKAGNCTNGHTTDPTCFSGQRGDIIVFADFASRYPDSMAGMSHLTVSQQSVHVRL
jgi:hypothetical protein